MSKQKDSLKEAEQKFYQDIQQLRLQENEELTAGEIAVFQDRMTEEIQVDVEQLSMLASTLIKEDPKQSDEEIAVKLLKNIAEHSKSKTLRKLATKMVREEWWKKQ